MKIFLGTNDVAKIMTGLKEGFLANGCEVTTLVKELHPFYNLEYDYTILRQFKNSVNYKNKLLRRAIEFADYSIQNYRIKKRLDRFIEEHDVFVFLWSSLQKKYADYRLIKKANKKIVNVFVGSEVRHISAFQEEFGGDQSTWEKSFHDDDLNSKIFTLRNAELYSDLILSVPDQAGLAIRPYDHLYLPFDSSKLQFNVPKNKLLKVVHAPSRSGIKGTELINKTIERIRNEGTQLEYKLLQNMSNQQLMDELKSADVLVDELYLHGPGMLSLEGMASGCAVATHAMLDYKQIFDPPVCNINETNIYDQLKRLFSDDDYRMKLVEEGKKFVDTKSSPAAVTKDILLKLNTPNLQHDYTPTFYLKNYKLPANTHLTQDNINLTKQILLKYGM